MRALDASLRSFASGVLVTASGLQRLNLVSLVSVAFTGLAILWLAKPPRLAGMI